MFASVQIVGSAQDSVIGERWRTCGPGRGVKGPQVQILSSRRKTAGQRPFRTQSEAASLLPCSHRCSHGTHSHQPIAAESHWTKERAVGGDRCETICSGTPATSMCAANQCHSVCRPTPFIPKALAASDRPQCLLGLTAVPLPVVNTRPVSALHPDRGRLEPLDCLARLDPPKSATVAGDRGTLRGERSVLGSLMTRCPLASESVPRTRRMLFGEVDVSALL